MTVASMFLGHLLATLGQFLGHCAHHQPVIPRPAGFYRDSLTSRADVVSAHQICSDTEEMVCSQPHCHRSKLFCNGRWSVSSASGKKVAIITEIHLLHNGPLPFI
jgi:hypothetical protein